MEPYFGHDFSQVRVHTDTWAAEPVRTINTLAYTVAAKCDLYDQQRPTRPGSRFVERDAIK